MPERRGWEGRKGGRILSFKEKEARTGRRSSWGGQAAPSATQRPPITIKHFNDLLSDESLDFIVIHHVSLRKEKKACLNYTSQPPLGIILMELKDGRREAKVPGATHRYLILTAGLGMVQTISCIGVFLGRGSRPPTLPHIVRAARMGIMLFPAEGQEEALK